MTTDLTGEIWQSGGNVSFYRLSTAPLRKSRKKVGTFFMKK